MQSKKNNNHYYEFGGCMRFATRFEYAVVALLFSVATVLAIYLFLRTAVFGQLPEGNRLMRVEQSVNYRDGEFKNLIDTPMFSEGNNFLTVNLKSLFTISERKTPDAPLPVVRTDLKSLPSNRDIAIWLGHSGYFIQVSGKRILIDPVFSTRASPVPFGGKAFAGTTPYHVEDIPDLDYLIITHDHYDHLDYPTIMALKNKVRLVVTGLGVGQDFIRWGYRENQLHELDWGESYHESGVTLHAIPARHYSGRAFERNQTLWTGYVIETPSLRMLFSGDSGYGPHYKEIANRFGGFDMVALDMGQYDPLWPYIHMTPEEASRAAEELNAKTLIPAHVARFALARHPWDDPFKRISRASQDKKYTLLTPRIGEPIEIGNTEQRFSIWWKEL